MQPAPQHALHLLLQQHLLLGMRLLLLALQHLLRLLAQQDLLLLALLALLARQALRALQALQLQADLKTSSDGASWR